MDALGPRIKRLRQQANLNKAALARLVGVSDVTISYWESGAIKQIGHERLVALADALGCQLSELLDDSAPPTPEVLQLNATPPVPWSKAPHHSVRLPPALLASAHAMQAYYLVTPAPGATFDYLGRGDLAAIHPTSLFRHAGIYVVEYEGEIQLRRLESDSEPSGGSLQVLGKVEAHWQLAS